LELEEETFCFQHYLGISLWEPPQSQKRLFFRTFSSAQIRIYKRPF